MREVDIVAHDYAFVAPSELSSGQVTFRFTNKGKVIHELDIALLKGGTTSRALMSAVNAGTPLKALIETGAGILIAPPGHRSSAGLTTELLPGRDYLVICRFRDRASARKHSQLGMITVIHVTPARAAPMIGARADTIVGVDYAFKAPLVLAPGRHTLTLVNGGTVVHEVNVALLRRGATIDQAFRILKVDGDLSPVVEEWLGVLFAKPGDSTMGRLEVTLLPDRQYVISCGLTNDDKASAHSTLGMFGSIHTTKAPRARR